MLERYVAAKPSVVPGTRSLGDEVPPEPSSLNLFRREFDAGRTPAPKRRSLVLKNRAKSFPMPSLLAHAQAMPVNAACKKKSVTKKGEK